MRSLRMRSATVIAPLLMLACCFALFANVNTAYAQESSNSSDKASGNETLDNRALLINTVAGRLAEKTAELQALRSQAGQNPTDPETTTKAATLNADVARLKNNLILSITDESTLLTVTDDEVETTWQEDIVDILEPLVDSLKNVTKRPRQIAEYRESLANIDQRQAGLVKAMDAFDAIDRSQLDEEGAAIVQQLLSGWKSEAQQLTEEHSLTTLSLNNLIDGQGNVYDNIKDSSKQFVLGTGLTIVLATIAAFATYFLMRLGWWLYSTKIVSKDVRRKSTLYRLSSYSYQLVTGIVVIIAILMILYLREDLLLLAIAFLLLAGLAFSLKQFLPQYFAEARLLLNLGSVREDERVLYNELPWHVESINVYSILRNPALDGIARLPLSEMETLVSRPVKNNLWFPTQKGDYVILPDGLLGKIKHQTPDLVEILVRGGMSMTYTTSDFYALNIINLSRDETFGVSVTFGLDYALQRISVDEIPTTLKAAAESALDERGYTKYLTNLVVELSAANDSSLDYLIFATLKKSVAGDFYKLERLILQTCVVVSNNKDWVIPFPQLTVHSVRN